MRFTVEERLLADGAGRPVTSHQAVSYHTFDAESVDDAIRLYVCQSDGEVIGNVMKFPGFQAIATVRKTNGVYTLQFTPASQGIKKTQG